MAEISAADLAVAVEIVKKQQGAMTDEQRTKNQEIRAAGMGTEEAKAETMAKMQAKFVECDADGDGRLNFDEYKAFLAGIAEGFKSQGGHMPELSEDDKKTTYDIHNKASGDEGVTPLEFMANMAQIREAAKAQA